MESVSSYPVALLQSNPAGLQSQIPWEFLVPTLMWDSEPLRHWENFSGVIVLLSVGHPPREHGFDFIGTVPPPTISMRFLLCIWLRHSFGEFQHPLLVVVQQQIAVSGLSQRRCAHVFLLCHLNQFTMITCIHHCPIPGTFKNFLLSFNFSYEESINIPIIGSGRRLRNLSGST